MHTLATKTKFSRDILILLRVPSTDHGTLASNRAQILAAATASTQVASNSVSWNRHWYWSSTLGTRRDPVIRNRIKTCYEWNWNATTKKRWHCFQSSKRRSEHPIVRPNCTSSFATGRTTSCAHFNMRTKKLCSQWVPQWTTREEEITFAGDRYSLQ